MFVALGWHWWCQCFHRLPGSSSQTLRACCWLCWNQRQCCDRRMAPALLSGIRRRVGAGGFWRNWFILHSMQMVHGGEAFSDLQQPASFQLLMTCALKQRATSNLQPTSIREACTVKQTCTCQADDWVLTHYQYCGNNSGQNGLHHIDTSCINKICMAYILPIYIHITKVFMAYILSNHALASMPSHFVQLPELLIGLH